MVSYYGNLKCSTDQTTPNSSSSLMLYLSSIEFKNCDANSTVCQPFGVRCSNAHPKPLREASHFISVSKSGLKCLFSVVSVNFSLINVSCFSCYSVQINFVFFLSRGRSG